MKKLTVSIIIIIGLFIVITFSCSDSINKKHLLHQSELLSDIAPDSSLMLLDSITHPEKMQRKDYMKYLVLRTKARFKTYQDISSDNEIFEAAAYFDKHAATPALKATANNQVAMVLFEQKKYAEAMNYLLKADEYAQMSDSLRLIALTKSYMGLAYYHMNNSEKAIPYYKETYNIFKKLPDEKLNQLINTYALANNYSINLKHDSAMHYSKESLILAREIKNKKYELQALNSLAVDYRHLGKPLKSKQVLLEALHSDIRTPGIYSRILVNLSKAYYDLNQLDSANYYMKLSFQELDNLPSTDNYRLLSAHQHQSLLKEKEGNYREALIHYKKYNSLLEAIRKKDRSDDLVRQEKSSEMSQKEKELVQADLRAQIWLSTTLSLVIIIILSVLAIIVMRNKSHKEKQKIKMLDKQIENVLFVNKLYRFITAESNAFEKEVGAVSLNYSIKENSKGYGIIQNMWKSMKKQTQDKMNEEAIAFLKEKSIDKTIIDSLTTPDLLYISLSQCNYDSKNIATMLGVSSHALHMRKQRLKDKLKNSGITDNEISKIIPD